MCPFLTTATSTTTTTTTKKKKMTAELRTARKSRAKTRETNKKLKREWLSWIIPAMWSAWRKQNKTKNTQTGSCEMCWRQSFVLTVPIHLSPGPYDLIGPTVRVYQQAANKIIDDDKPLQARVVSTIINRHGLATLLSSVDSRTRHIILEEKLSVRERCRQCEKYQRKIFRRYV